MTRYDVAVVGAGLGGLTAAALLAREGLSVLVVERSNSVGGAASSYKSGDLFVEGSLHVTSDPRDARDPKHAPLTRAGVLDAVNWIPTGALYEARGGPLSSPLAIPSGFAEAAAALVSRSPAHRDAIAALIADMNAAVDGEAVADVSLAVRLDAAFGGNEAAKAAVAANLSSFHDDAATLPWAVFARGQGRMLRAGPCFIEGGSQRLSSALARAVRRAKGEIVLRRAVSAIRLDARGVISGVTHTARDGGDAKDIDCARVILNAAPARAASLLPAPAAQAFGSAYAGRERSISLFALTLGLKAPPQSFGLTAYWTQLWPDWMTSLADYPRATRLFAEPPGERMPALSIANYSAIESGLPSPPHVVSVIGADRRANWPAQSPAAYRAHRAKWQAALIAHLGRNYPGIAAAVTQASFNTALSVEQYLGVPDGAVYGFAPRAAPLAVETPLGGLLLASAWAGEGRFNGAVAAGAACADAILAARR